MASKFWGAESSDEESVGSSSGSEDFAPRAPVAARPSRFMDSSDSEDERRVVVSTKDKRLAELAEVVGKLRNAARADDWQLAKGLWVELDKVYKKAGKFIKQDGTPSYFVRVLVMLEEAVGVNIREKKLSKTHAKAFNRLKQEVKKYNAKFSGDVAKCRADPTAFPWGASLGDDDESEDEAGDEAAAAGDAGAGAGDDFGADDFGTAGGAGDFGGSKFAAGGADSDDSMDWGDDDDDSSDDDDDWQESGGSRASKWLLKKGDDDDDSKDVRKREKGDRSHRKKESKTTTAGAAGGAAAKEEESVEVTPAVVSRRLRKILAGRGKKGTDRGVQRDLLAKLLALSAKWPKKQVEVLSHLISAQFDASPNIHTSMEQAEWEKCFQSILQLATMLYTHKDIKILGDATMPTTGADGTVASTDEQLEEAGVLRVDLSAFLDRLETELRKSLKVADPHTREYLVRLADESKFLVLAELVHGYYESRGDVAVAAAVASLRLEHLYFVHTDVSTLMLAQGREQLAAAQYAAHAATVAGLVPSGTGTGGDGVSLDSVVRTLVKEVFKSGTERMKTRGMLCFVYYCALHGHYYEARNLLLMSHLQETIHQVDVETQVLFNRTMAQLGLAAFAAGQVYKAMACLSELYATGRIKELLAQGTNARYGEKNVEREKAEKRRQLPYHMHINLDLLEAVHLICSMLIEVPTLVSPLESARKKAQSKTFRRLLDHAQRQYFTGPPESTRDFVIAASLALMEGDWKRCDELLASLKVWALLPPGRKDVVLPMLRAKVQEEGLRAYLLAYARQYDALGLDAMAKMFALPSERVHAIVSKMIVGGKLLASWNQPTQTIVMHKREPTRLQSMALQFADKAANLVEQNERMLDVRMGGYGYKYDAPKDYQRAGDKFGNRGKYNARR